MNESRMFYVLIRNATVINGTGVPPFTADIGIVANRRVQIVDGQRRVQMSLGIDDLGDLRTMGALRTIDAHRHDGGADRATTRWRRVRWSICRSGRRRRAATIAVGQAGEDRDPEAGAEPGKYVVESVSSR